MTKMQAVFYRSVDGKEPVDDFIGRLNIKRQVAIDNQIDRLNDLADNGPPLPFPHSPQVDAELRELRCHYGNELYRILYRRSNNLFILLHVLRKSTGRIPGQDIEIASERWADFKARMDTPVRRPPRAAGHDAPPSRQ
jgi:phage-related protein